MRSVAAAVHAAGTRRRPGVTPGYGNFSRRRQNELLGLGCGVIVIVGGGICATPLGCSPRNGQSISTIAACADMVVPRVRLWFRGRGFFPGRAKSRRLILKQLRTISGVLDSLADKCAGGRRNLRRCRRPRSDSWGRWAICRIRRECRAHKPADTGPTRGRAARA